MSDLLFDFCDTSRVLEEVAPEEMQAISMNGWPFTSKPKTPYQRKFKATLDGLRWIMSADGTSLDTTTEPKFNIGRLLAFYRLHRMWDSFLINHEYLGTLRVRFAAPINPPKAIPNSRGLIESFEIQLIHADPVY